MKNIGTMLFGLGIGVWLAFTSAYAQEPLNCKKHKKLVKTQERAYSNLIKGQDYFQKYMEEKQLLGIIFTDEQLSDINYVFSFQRNLEKNFLEQMRKEFEKNCPES